MMVKIMEEEGQEENHCTPICKKETNLSTEAKLPQSDTSRLKGDAGSRRSMAGEAAGGTMCVSVCMRACVCARVGGCMCACIFPCFKVSTSMYNRYSYAGRFILVAKDHVYISLRKGGYVSLRL